MTHPIATRMLDRALIDVIERLSVQFPELPIGTIRRAVEAVGHGHEPVDVRAVNDLAHATEMAARNDLLHLAAADAA